MTYPIVPISVYYQRARSTKFGTRATRRQTLDSSREPVMTLTYNVLFSCCTAPLFLSSLAQTHLRPRAIFNTRLTAPLFIFDGAAEASTAERA